jgi:hypothetical protein
VIFDGILAFAGYDDDVLDAGGDALFNDILNLRLVDDGEHFFRLSFGGGQEARAKAGGRKDRLAYFLATTCGSVGSCRLGRVGRVVVHRVSFCAL